MRVLVVEDQAEVADDIADGLRDQGIGVDVAYDGPAGIEKTLINSYDVVILDRDLPGVHGDAVCATLAGSGSAARPDADRRRLRRRPGAGSQPRR
jgi:DNA-binding response OmpR family regulator